MKENIVLIGMPGVGKSTLGVVLAKELGFQFVDADLLIQERENRLLKEIIAEDGVEGFLKIENDVNASIRAEKTVIATGGSVIYGSDAMEHLKERHLIPVIHEVIQEKIPFLGICLGLQLLFEESDESPGVPGLSILKGKIRRIPEKSDLKVPHIGWNDLSFPHEGKLFAGITGNPYVYFVHSYYLDATDKDIVCATTSYGVRIDASVEAKNVFACQFHPEKSSDVGLRILKNFAEI